jgi:hypothetical protein
MRPDPQDELIEGDIEAYELHALTFINSFLLFPIGGAKLDITPYIHWVVYHAAAAMRLHGALGLYTCQTLERNNSRLRHYVHNACNFDGQEALGAMLHEMEADVLKPLERGHRPQKKRKDAKLTCDDSDSDGEESNPAKRVALGSPASAE